MSKILLLGCGRQAFGAAYALAKLGHDLVLADAVQGPSGRLHYWLTDKGLGTRVIKSEHYDWMSQDLLAAIDDCDGVFSGIPYHITGELLKVCIARGKTYVDLGCEPPDIAEARKLPQLSDPQNTFVFDAGLAPGLLNQLGECLQEEMKGAESCQLFCGGLPKKPWGPFGYYPYFAPESVVAEYLDDAVVLKEGIVVKRPGLSELETVEVPGEGTLEAFLTSGGESDAPGRLAKRIKNFEYKTLRYPGHCAAMTLMRDAGFWNPEPLAEGETPPLSIFCRLLASGKGQAPPDKVVGLARVKAGDMVSEASFVHHFDSSLGLSAMSQMTGFPAAIILDQALKSEPRGLLSAGEWGRAKSMTKALKEFGVKIRTRSYRVK